MASLKRCVRTRISIFITTQISCRSLYTLMSNNGIGVRAGGRGSWGATGSPLRKMMAKPQIFLAEASSQNEFFLYLKNGIHSALRVEVPELTRNPDFLLLILLGGVSRRNVDIRIFHNKNYNKSHKDEWKTSNRSIVWVTFARWTVIVTSTASL